MTTTTEADEIFLYRTAGELFYRLQRKLPSGTLVMEMRNRQHLPDAVSFIWRINSSRDKTQSTEWIVPVLEMEAGDSELIASGIAKKWEMLSKNIELERLWKS
tara:strand:- start:6907 stop:7215 length:309 start_codon:yes stop_codon:yes gene_type:complete